MCPEIRKLLPPPAREPSRSALVLGGFHQQPRQPRSGGPPAVTWSHLLRPQAPPHPRRWLPTSSRLSISFHESIDGAHRERAWLVGCKPLQKRARESEWGTSPSVHDKPDQETKWNRNGQDHSLGLCPRILGSEWRSSDLYRGQDQILRVTPAGVETTVHCSLSGCHMHACSSKERS